MRQLVVLISLLSVLAASLAWAGDPHALGTESDTQAAHHSHTGTDPHPSRMGGCHVFHCQALVHLGSLPPAPLAVSTSLRRLGVARALPPNLRSGVIVSPWRPPTL